LTHLIISVQIILLLFSGQLTNLKQKQIKQLAAQLSVEQQLYSKEITEACVCSDQARRAVRD
jgi:hypothetical protein